ncbi:MAG: DNA polymerase [Chloroflexota bacterium]|nr:DNA polymerase [Chloroflexota bacterium]
MPSDNGTTPAANGQSVGEKRLLPEHRRLIEASAIAPDVAAARGYHSVTTKAEARDLGFAPSQCRTPALYVPAWDVHGQNGTGQLRPDDPRLGDDGRVIKYETAKGGRNRLDVPPPVRGRLGNPAVPLWITEGARKADSAASRGLCCVSIAGVANWRGKNDDGGLTALVDWEHVHLKGRLVYLAFDSDAMTKAPVYRELIRLGRFLASRGADVRYVYLPAGPGEAKVGLDDFFAGGGTVEELAALATTEPRLPQRDDAGKPVLDAGEQRLGVITPAAWAAVEATNDPPYLFLSGGSPVRLEWSKDGEPVLKSLTEDRLRHAAARAATWVKRTPAGDQPAGPPDRAIADMLACADLPLPPLERIVSAPVFGPGGELQTEPGYHPAGRTYYAPDAGFALPPVPEHPTAAECDEAKRLLLDELLADFPFVAEADRAHAVGEMLLPFVRAMIAGPTPIHLHEAPTAGNGKDLLAEAALWPALGGMPRSMPYTPNREEMRKRITSTLRELPDAVVIPNVNAVIDSGDLADAVTRPVWQDRVLGLSETVRVPVRCVWVVTANNPGLSKEIARRAIRIRLDARRERPWERPSDSFRHPKLLRWARERRAELVWAALTVVRRWLAAGSPLGSATLGTFESWAGVVGGILEEAGIPGFLGNLRELYDASDVETGAWGELVEAWWAEHADGKVGTGQLFPLTEGIVGFDFGKGSEKSQQTAFGMQLAKQRDRIYGERLIVAAGEFRRVKRWRLISVDPDPPTAPPHPEDGCVPCVPCVPSVPEPSTIQTAPVAKAVNQNLARVAKGTQGTQGTHPPDTTCTLIASDAALAAVLPDLRVADALGFDTETYTPPERRVPLPKTATKADKDRAKATNPRRDRMRLIQLADRDDHAYLIDADAVDVSALAPLFAGDTGPVLIGHNLGFEIAFLSAAGLPVPPAERLWDTMIASKLLGAAGTGSRLGQSLEDVALRELGVALDKAMQQEDWFGELSERHLAYAATDATVVRPLRAKLDLLLVEAGLERVFALETAILPAMAAMEGRGVRFDPERIEALIPTLSNDKAAAEQAWRAVCPDLKPSQALKIGERLAADGLDLPETTTGRPSTAEDALRPLTDRHPLIAPLLAYREVDGNVKKAKEYRAFTDPVTGRIHPSWKQIGAETGRMSCASPCLQQVPTEPRFRRLVVPDPGNVFVQADLSQTELRCLAVIADDEAMLDAFRQGIDLHDKTAWALFGLPDGTRAEGKQRRLAKAINFGIAYGAGPERLRQSAKAEHGIDVALEEATAYKDRFFATYPGVHRWYRANLYTPNYGDPAETRTLLGRRRLNTTGNEKINTPIQGTAADLLKLALAKMVADPNRPPTADVVMLVHDEVLIEVREEHAGAARDWLIRNMEEAARDVLGDVPMPLNPETVHDWSEKG